jgi:hypothetical protein
MKRSTVKLVIRRETLRQLTGMEVRLAGGALDTSGGVTGCARAQQADSAGAGTGCPLVKA